MSVWITANCRLQMAAAALLLVLLLAIMPASAQSTTAIVLGSVTDASGAVIAAATVSVKNIETGITQTATTDTQGRYRVPELKIGSYEVQASQAGFQTVVLKGVTLTVGSESIIDISLPVGQSQQTVTVEAQASQVDTTSATVATLVESTQMKELPLNGRNFEQLLSLGAGVQVLPATGGTQYGSQQNYSIAGSRPLGQLFLIDNTNFAGYFNHGTGSGAAGTSLGMESIAEFQTLTNTYSAQFGGNGAAVNAVTKSGTNSLHGSAYEFLRNSVLDARNFFDTLRRPGENDARVPSFRRNQFGGSIGGPIKKDRTFFFTNYEGFRQGLGQTSTAFVPDVNAKQGYLPCATASTFTCNPTTGFAFVGIAPRIASTLALYPTATNPTGGGVGTVQQLGKAITNEDYFLVRVDHNVSDKDSLFVRYVRDRANVNLPFASTPIPLYPEGDFTANDFATVEWKRLISPTLVNLARVSFLRPNEGAGLPNSIPALQYFSGSGRPDGRVLTSSLSILGPVQDDPYYYTLNHYVAGDDLIWSHGAHSIRFGLTLDRIQDNTQLQAGAGGAWTFTSLQNLLLGVSSQFAGPLPGQGDNVRDVRELRIQPYFHDEWKVTRRLTLNLGVRYELTTNPTEARNKFHNLINRPFGAYVSVPNAFASNPSVYNLDPRVGLAYDPFGDHKTAIRAGFGMFHDVTLSRYFAGGYIRSLPFNNSSQAFPTYPFPFLGGTSPVTPSTNNNTEYTVSKTPYMMQYNLNIQRDLGHGLVATIGYVGSRGVHLWGSKDSNPPIPGVGPNGQDLFGRLVSGKITPNVRINPAYSFLVTRDVWGSSNYNSLQATLNRRFTHNLQAQVSYTFSKSLDYGSATSPQEIIGGVSSAQDPFNVPSEYGRSTFDRTHALRVSGVYALPSPKNGVAGQLAGGWQLSGFYSVSSGAPFTPLVGFDQAGLQAGNTQRPNLAPGRSGDPLIGSPNQWFDPTAFTLPIVGTVGNLGRSTIIGPDLANLDLALSKNMKISKISEQFNAQFRAEVFNLFNRANFAIPNNNIFVQGANGGGSYDPTSGQITSTVTSARQIQFALKLTF